MERGLENAERGTTEGEQKWEIQEGRRARRREEKRQQEKVFSLERRVGMRGKGRVCCVVGEGGMDGGEEESEREELKSCRLFKRQLFLDGCFGHAQKQSYHAIQKHSKRRGEGRREERGEERKKRRVGGEMHGGHDYALVRYTTNTHASTDRTCSNNSFKGSNFSRKKAAVRKKMFSKRSLNS